MTTRQRSIILSLFGALLVLHTCTVLTLQDASPTKMPPKQTEHNGFDNTYEYVIIVDPDNDKATDSEACHPKPGGENSTVPCQSLQYVFQQFHSLNSVLFYLALSISNYTLHNVTTFQNVNNVSIIGNNSTNHSVVIQCDPLAGLSFLNSSSIKLSYVQFVGCGAQQNSTSRDFTQPQFKMLLINVTLYFYMCNDVVMDHVNVNHSSHATGVVMYDTNGHIQVSSCFFYNNTAADNGIPGGGAFTVEFTYCSPGDTSCSPNYTSYDPGYRVKNLSAEYVFTDCIFEHNIARGQNFTSRAGNVVFASLANHTGVGRGGGLSVFFKGVAINKSVNITGCNFVQNSAVWGGGLLLEMDDNTISNKVIVSGCNFTRNHAFNHEKSGTGGGGLRVATTVYFWDDTYQQKNYTKSEILVEYSTFNTNKAIEGGAISFSIARQTSSYFSQLTHLFVSDCTFNNNRAQLGAAVTAAVYPIFNRGSIPSLTFSNCRYLNNRIADHLNESKNDPLKSHPSGMGTVYVDEVPVTFSKLTAFNDNHGTALSVVGAQVDFSGSKVVFSGNSGTSGGAIALLGASSILTGPNTLILFENNNASIHGGAIYNRYITKEDFSSSVNCFVRYSDPFVGPFQWQNVTIYFENNKAKKFGDSIYSTAILPCSWGVPLTGKINSIFCLKSIWQFFGSNCKAEIYSEPIRMHLRPNTSSEIKVFPGREFLLPLDAFDDFDHNVTIDAVYAADIDSPYAAVEPSFSYVADNYVGITGKPGKNVSMSMYTAGSRTTYISVSLTILSCPPGFVTYTNVNISDHDEYDSLTEANYEPWLSTYEDVEYYDDYNSSVKNFSCVCPTKVTFRGNLRCLYHEFHSQIDNRYWIGNSIGNSTELLMGLVPQYYTTSALYGDEFIDLPTYLNSTDEKLCGGGNRTGILCGQCIKGYGVAINSPKFPCVACNKTTLTTKVGLVFAYIALTYVPILFLFFAIILFNFKLTSSAALSFVLYAQMIGSGVFNLTAGEAFYLNEPNVARMELAYTTVYGIFNLNSLSFLMDPFCVSERLTTLSVISLEYAIASFPLVMIAVIYLVYRCKALKCSCWTRRSRRLHGLEPSTSSTVQSTDGLRETKISAPKSTLIHAFVAFLFLSYTKFSLASMFTMSITELFNAAGHSYGSNIIYFAGHLSFTDSEYLLPYGIIAILVLVFIVILPPLLLLGPIQFIDWLIDKQGFTCLQRLWPSIKVHTFLDTFQGFYKPNRRFFSGVYFLFRLTVFITFSFSRTIISQYVFQQVAVMILIVLVALLRPYTREFYNYLDILIFFNLGTINALAIYIFTNKTSSFPYAVYAIEYVLVWLPLVYIICYAVWNRVHKRQCYQTAKKKLFQIFHPARYFLENSTSEERGHLLNGQTDRSLEDSVNFTSEDPDEGLFRRANRRNRYSRTRNVHGRDKVTTTIVSVGEETEEDLIKQDSGTSTGGSSRSDMHSNDS